MAGTNVVAVCLIALGETVPVTCAPRGGADCYETLRGGERRQCQRPAGARAPSPLVTSLRTTPRTSEWEDPHPESVVHTLSLIHI